MECISDVSSCIHACGFLDYEARKCYFQNLQTESEVLPDPYGPCSLENEQWIDDVWRWPSLEFGELHTYLIETKGPLPENHWKAYKSLEEFTIFTVVILIRYREQVYNFKGKGQSK